MNKNLQNFDAELYNYIIDSMDKHEIREGSSERIVIENWLADALIIESMLNLMRNGMIDICGVRIKEDKTFEPEFMQSVK
jgi:homoserine acetyltransferase